MLKKHFKYRIFAGVVNGIGEILTSNQKYVAAGLDTRYDRAQEDSSQNMPLVNFCFEYSKVKDAKLLSAWSLCTLKSESASIGSVPQRKTAAFSPLQLLNEWSGSEVRPLHRTPNTPPLHDEFSLLSTQRFFSDEVIPGRVWPQLHFP